MKTAASFLLLLPSLAFSAPFDGTWVAKQETAKIVGKPDHYLLADGMMFTCGPCTPSYTLKADGSQHKVKGHAYYDSVSIKIIDANTLDIKNYAGEKLYAERRMSVSADGKTLTEDLTSYQGPSPVKAALVSSRVAPAPAGTGSISGSWKSDTKNTTFPAEFLTVTYTESADGLKMSSPIGQSFDAKFDGKPVLTDGDTGKTMVSLKRIDARTIQETDTRGGKVTDTYSYKVSADGKTMKVVDRDPIHGTVTSYTAEKQ